MSQRMISAGLAATMAGIGLMAMPGIANADGANSTSSAPASAAAPTCQNSQVKASYKYEDSGAGSTSGFIVLLNTSSSSCTIGGWGGLSYVGDGDGTQIGRAAVRKGKKYLKTIAPGQRVRSPLVERVARNFPTKTCRPHPVDGFRVYIPNATKSQYIPHKTTGCLNSTLVLMTHGSYR